MVEKLTSDLLSRVNNEIKKDENQKKIEIEILNPILVKFSNKIYPYVKIVFFIFILNFMLVFIILILIIIFNKKSNIINNG